MFAWLARTQFNPVADLNDPRVAVLAVPKVFSRDAKMQTVISRQLGVKHGRQKQGCLAVVTGASSAIGLELARCCAGHGYDLVIAADEPENEDAAQTLRGQGSEVETVLVDLATDEGVDTLVESIRGRPVAVLIANAGHGLGHAFLDQDFVNVRHVIDTNVTGTVHLIHRIARDMRARQCGRILVTGSIAGFIPGSFQAVYTSTTLGIHRLLLPSASK